MENSHTGGRISHFEFYRNAEGELVRIPSSQGLEGYVAFDTLRGKLVQARLLKTDDSAKRAEIEELWTRVGEVGGGSVFPEILGSGIEQSIPFYFSELPGGEPISQFVDRVGTLSPEASADLVSRFIGLWESRDPAFQGCVMVPHSIWMVRGESGRPRFELGEVCAESRSNSEVENARLFFEMLRYLSGNPPFDQAFQELCSAIEQGQASPAAIAARIEGYLDGRTDRVDEFWNESNQPLIFGDCFVVPEGREPAQPFGQTDSEYGGFDRAAGPAIRPSKGGLLSFIGAVVAFVLLTGGALYWFAVDRDELSIADYRKLIDEKLREEATGPAPRLVEAAGSGEIDRPPGKSPIPRILRVSGCWPNLCPRPNLLSRRVEAVKSKRRSALPWSTGWATMLRTFSFPSPERTRRGMPGKR